MTNVPNYSPGPDPQAAVKGPSIGLMVAAGIGNLFGDRWMYYQITGYTFAFAALVWRAQQLTDEAAESQARESIAELEQAPA